MVFCASFPTLIFDYFSAISIINCIDYKTERKTIAYDFIPFIFNKVSIIRNIVLLEDLNIFQIGVDKTNSYYANHFMI